MYPRFYGRGLPAFVDHAWGRGEAPGFRVRAALPCADVLVARDSLPSTPFPGAVLYIDHEAGLGPGRDAGRLDVVLEKYKVIYLGKQVNIKIARYKQVNIKENRTDKQTRWSTWGSWSRRRRRPAPPARARHARQAAASAPRSLSNNHDNNDKNYDNNDML